MDECDVCCEVVTNYCNNKTISLHKDCPHQACVSISWSCFFSSCRNQAAPEQGGTGDLWFPRQETHLRFSWFIYPWRTNISLPLCHDSKRCGKWGREGGRHDVALMLVHSVQAVLRSGVLLVFCMCVCVCLQNFQTCRELESAISEVSLGGNNFPATFRRYGDTHVS